MGFPKAIPLFLVVSLWPVSVRELQEERQVPPGRIQASEAMRRFEKGLKEDHVQPRALQPDWEKARGDASQLLALAQQIHGQLQAGPHQISAPLAGELNQVERLVKRLRKKLLL